jgi:Flp pilus assembly protein TadD
VPVIDPSAKEGARAAYEVGQQKLAAGDNAGAVESFREALRLAPWSAPSIRGLGMAYEAQGDKPKAASAYEQYLRFAPKAADAEAIQQKIDGLRGRH